MSYYDKEENIYHMVQLLTSHQGSVQITSFPVQMATALGDGTVVGQEISAVIIQMSSNAVSVLFSCTVKLSDFFQPYSCFSFSKPRTVVQMFSNAIRTVLPLCSTMKPNVFFFFFFHDKTVSQTPVLTEPMHSFFSNMKLNLSV